MGREKNAVYSYWLSAFRICFPTPIKTATSDFRILPRIPANIPIAVLIIRKMYAVINVPNNSWLNTWGAYYTGEWVSAGHNLVNADASLH